MHTMCLIEERGNVSNRETEKMLWKFSVKEDHILRNRRSNRGEIKLEPLTMGMEKNSTVCQKGPA